MVAEVPPPHYQEILIFGSGIPAPSQLALQPSQIRRFA
jgi:hypothetical protein